MARLLILGISHNYQHVRILNTNVKYAAFERDTKLDYRGWLLERAKSLGAEMVCEETIHDPEWRHTWASDIADELEIPYLNVEMPPADRGKRGIPSGYNDRTSEFTPEQIEVWNSERERFMYDRTKSAIAAGISNVLVVCGMMHKDRLQTLFEASGDDVTADSIDGQSWYIADWITHCIRLPHF